MLLSNLTLIGERINPGFARSKALLDAEDLPALQALAVSQVEKGAHCLTINVGDKATERPDFLVRLIEAVQEAVDVPEALNCPHRLVQELCLRTYRPERARSRKPIVNVEDLKGLKLRVIPNPLFLESFAALGTNPVPMAFPELYGALESKAMDAQENPFAVVLTSKFNEVQKYLSVTNHVYTANPVVISKKTWEKLSAAEQKIIQDAIVEAGTYQRKLSRDASATSRKALEAAGMQINDVPAATLAKMRDITQPVAEKFAASYDQSVVKIYRAEIEKVRAGTH